MYFVCEIKCGYSTADYHCIYNVGFECDELESLEKGVVSKLSNSLGSVANYSCEPGFMISGPRERVCQLSPAWSSPTPSCERKEITHISSSSLLIVHVLYTFVYMIL